MKTKILFLPLFFTIFSVVSFGGIFFENIPRNEPECKDYQLFLNGVDVPIHLCRVSACPFNQVWPGYQRPVDQTETTGFAYWDMDAPVAVEIKVFRPFKKVVIRPTSRGIVSFIDRAKNSIRFKIDRPGPLVIEIDGTRKALHLFPSKMEPEPFAQSRPGYRYFGPGVHQAGIISMKSGETIYIDSGAIVYGSIRGKNVSDVKVLGRGILDQSKFERGKGGGAFRFEGCKNVHLEGIVLRDPDVWTVNIFNCDNVTVRNLYLVGLWRYNADGIDICNSRDVLVEGCFVRSFDDALVVKGLASLKNLPVRNVTFRNNVVWCDWGRAFEIGAETCASEIKNVSFESSDIIRTDSVAMDIQHGDGAKIKKIKFENIRVEIDDFCPRPVLQKKKDEKYVNNPKGKHIPALLVIVIRKTNYSKNKELGTVEDVLYKDIKVLSKRIPNSIFAGSDEKHDIDGIKIQNLQINGKIITKVNEMNLYVRPYVSNLIFTK